MCVDISFHSDHKLIVKDFPQILDKRNSKISGNSDQLPAFLFPEVPIIYLQDGSKLLSEMNWGVDPFYISDPKERVERKRHMLNARSERILDDKKSYWHRLKDNRCLIPVSGTYEHRKIKGWDKKVPYYIWIKDRLIQYIPALYQVHEVVENGVISYDKTFTMITRKANEVMCNIHNDGDNKHRMPLFLTPELEQAWILPDLTENDVRDIFNFEIPAEALGYQTVYTLRGVDERPDGKHKYEPWKWENLPELGNDTPPKAQLSLF